MVVIGHSAGAVALLSPVSDRGGGHALLAWGASVELFFVVSGFIMVYASQRLFGAPLAARTFLLRRLVRIVPLYWVATSLYLALLAAAHWKGGDPFPSTGEVAASFLFLPYSVMAGSMSFPVLSLGWTLNYEIAFYVVFAACVGLQRRQALLSVAAVLLLLVAVGIFVPPEMTAPFFWTRPILLDFLAGVGVGALAVKGVRLAGPLRWLLVIGGAVLLLWDPLKVFSVPLGATVENGFPRVFVAGLPATALLAGGVLGPPPKFETWLRPLAGLGDASYSLYLFHPFAMIAMEKAAQKLPIVREAPPALLVVFTVSAAILIALGAYHGFEQPLNAALNRRVGQKRKPAGSLSLSAGAP